MTMCSSVFGAPPTPSNVNRWVKVQGNVIRETIEDPLRGPLPSKPSFWSQVLRFQVVL